MSGFARTIHLALKSLLVYKLRSGLTMLGIVFGVFSVIAMLAIGEGASRQAQEQVLALGAQNIIIVSKKPPQNLLNMGQNRSRVLKYGLTREELRILKRTLSTVYNVIPIREAEQKASFRGREMTVRLVGCTPEYQDVNHLKIAVGRFLTDEDAQMRRPYCVIANDIATQMFKSEDPIGKKFLVGELVYTIIGVTKPRGQTAAIGGSLSGQNFDKDVYIPLETFWSKIGDLIINRSSGSFSAEQIEISQIVLQVKNIEDVKRSADMVRETFLVTKPNNKGETEIIVPLELLKQAEQIRAIFGIVLGSIAAISLIVGGIGIMNIMLATVTERTREIGIRRALGATQKDIVKQFLTETTVLSGTGGLIGVILGLLTPASFKALQWIMNNYVIEEGGGVSDTAKLFTDITPVINVYSLPLAFGISVAIGIIFGLYPAWSAAKLDPIEALRHE